MHMVQCAGIDICIRGLSDMMTAHCCNMCVYVCWLGFYLETRAVCRTRDYRVPWHVPPPPKPKLLLTRVISYLMSTCTLSTATTHVVANLPSLSRPALSGPVWQVLSICYLCRDCSILPRPSNIYPLCICGSGCHQMAVTFESMVNRHIECSHHHARGINPRMCFLSGS